MGRHWKNPNFNRFGFSKIALAGCSFNNESTTANKDNYGPVSRMIFNNNVTSSDYGRPWLAHSERVNLLFLDGHVSPTGRNELTGYFHPALTGKNEPDRIGSCTDGTTYVKLR